MPPQPEGQASQENRVSGSENSSNSIIEIPLYWGKKAFHHKRSLRTDIGICWTDFLPCIWRNHDKSLHINTLLAWMQEEMKDNLPIKDWSSCKVASVFNSQTSNKLRISCNRSGVTLRVNSSESKRTPIKVILVEGGQAFCLDSSMLHDSNSCPNSIKDLCALAGSLAPAKSSK